MTRKDTKESTPGLPRIFWVLWAGTFINRAATFVAPYLMLYLTVKRGMTASAAGEVLALEGTCLALSNVLGGWLADRWGQKPTMLVGLSATTVAVFLLPGIRQTWLLILLVALIGLSSDLHRPALNSLVADRVNEHGRVRAYSLLHWATNLGMSFSLLAGGFLADLGYGWLFRLDAVATAVFAVVIFRLVPDLPANHARVGAASAADRGAYWWRDGRLLAFLVVTTLVFAVYFQNYTTLPLAVTAARLSAGDYGIVLALNALIVAILQPLTASRLGRFPHSSVLAISYVLIGAGYGLVALATNLPAFGGTVLVWTLGEVGVVAVGSAFATALAPVQSRGRYLGAYGAAIACSAGVAPLAGTALYQVSRTGLWTACLLVGVLAAAVQLALRPSAAAEPLIIATKEDT